MPAHPESLTPHAAEVLRCVYRLQPTSIYKVAANTGLPVGKVASILTGPLTRLGLVRWAMLRGKRRPKTLVITEEGKRWLGVNK
jgi:predicted transcriptional regulator